jgi:hypothetical protein
MSRCAWMLGLVAVTACGFPRPAYLVDASNELDGSTETDVSTDAGQTCYGSGRVHICLDAAPTAPLTIFEPTTLDTDSSSLCAHITSEGSYCVLAGTSITVNYPLRATGTKPLVLVASDAITTFAIIDVGSHHDVVPEMGAGADAAACMLGKLPGTSGGGAGGSFLGLGGGGGTPIAGEPGPTVSGATPLRGGCAGQDGQGTPTTSGHGGHGGGALYLIAENTIDVRGGLNAAGEAGAGGVTSQAGGGGGGSGGMIEAEAPTIVVSSLVLANGGGGGEGSDQLGSGSSGSDPSGVAAAAGGASLATDGGDGGAGSAGDAAGNGRSGNAGNPGRGGGGGGGGGAGLIRVPPGATLVGAQISPALS